MNRVRSKSIKSNPVKVQLPNTPFTEEELIQKPRPSFVTVIRGSKVNHFNLENYEKESKPKSFNR